MTSLHLPRFCGIHFDRPLVANMHYGHQLLQLSIRLCNASDDHHINLIMIVPILPAHHNRGFGGQRRHDKGDVVMRCIVESCSGIQLDILYNL